MVVNNKLFVTQDPITLHILQHTLDAAFHNYSYQIWLFSPQSSQIPYEENLAQNILSFSKLRGAFIARQRRHGERKGPIPVEDPQRDEGLYVLYTQLLSKFHS